MKSWNMDEKGQVTLLPLAEYTTALLAGASIAVRLELIPDADAFISGERDTVQFVMALPQAREFAEALLRLTDVAEEPPTVGCA